MKNNMFKKLITILLLKVYVFSISIIPFPELPGGIPREDAMRPGSHPFICCDTFRKICQHRFDETDFPFDPYKIQPGDKVFITSKFEYMNLFFKEFYPKIQNPFILISGGTIATVPGIFKKYLDDSKIIAWFSTNTRSDHPKSIALPLGLPNPHWKNGDVNLFKDLIENNKLNPPDK